VAETEKGEEKNDDGCAGFIAKVRQRGSDTRWMTAHAEQEVATTATPRSGSKITGDGGRWRPAVGGDFEKFTKMPLAKFYKILSNFL
jgi:hypothetical protein